MSKEMENQSFNERNSLTGNSGFLGLTSLRSKLQPVRVKALLEMYGSDEEDSEDKGKESDSESDCDEIQQLPDDDEEALEETSPTAKNRNEEKDNCNRAANVEVVDQQFKEQCERQDEIQLKQEKINAIENIYTSERLQFTNNFSSYEQSSMRLENHRSSSLPAEFSSSGTYASSAASKSFIESNRVLNVKFKAPDLLYSSNNNSQPVVTAKSEYTTHGGHYSTKAKFEPSESSYISNVRHLHATNVASQSDPSATSASVTVHAPTVSHLITDTPHKNNPPVGSMRPVPSVSHRSIFQTPQNSRIHQQDYSKNHVQTPATIFGNWSQRHMAQTPMQSRSAILPSDSVRAQTPLILGSQHTNAAVAATAGSSHETPWYRGTEEKKIRRPLAETIQSNVNHPQHLQSEKHPTRYTTDSSAGFSKHQESPDNPQERNILESIKDKCSIKSTQQQHHHRQHESKENRHPPPLIDKLPKKEEEQGSRGNFENPIKESIGSGSDGNVLNENRSEAARNRLETCDPPASRDLRPNVTTEPKNTALAESMHKNNAVSKKKTKVQLSIPSSIHRPNQGETIMVKGKDYLILGTLGEGMSGYVLRVQDLTSLELRAIKVVNLSRMDKDCAQGCMQEISMLHKLQAPCVVKMFDYDIQFPMVHVVMEMGDTDFRSLLHSMSEKRRLPLTMILYYWTEMLTAVKHIHDNGVIHSDLKPANFLLVRGRLKLIDFGIASSMNADMTSVVRNSPIGTLNYISPEAVMDVSGGGTGGDSPNQNVKYKISYKSDVWSLGCILYSLVYGYTPFHNIRAQWAKIQAITNPNPKISFRLPAENDVEPTPPILIDVMRKCLQHDPKARPTATQLLQIPYIPIKPSSRTLVPDIPSNIVMKIRHSLTDDEWRKFTEIMEARGNQS